MFRAVGSTSRFILHVHIENEVISRRNNRIFDFHFCFGDTDDFVSPYFTMGKPE